MGEYVSSHRISSPVPAGSSETLTVRPELAGTEAAAPYSVYQGDLNMRQIAMVLLAAGLLSAQERFDLKVRTLFFAGFSGDTASLEKGMKICEDTLAADPKAAEALVWHGSGLFFQSGQAFQKGDQQKGGELWARGQKEMDAAWALAPDNLGVRIPRGASLMTASRYLPSPDMARPLLEKAVSDFEKTYEYQGPDLSRLATHPRCVLVIQIADGYSRLGQQEKATEIG